MSKHILALLLTLASAVTAQAKCHPRYLTFWPQAPTVQANSLFMVEGLADAQQVVKALGTDWLAYLQAGTERIPLKVEEVLTGQYHLAQAILRPQGELKVGQQYELIIVAPDKPQDNMIFKYNGWGKHRVLYTVVAGNDRTAPTWLAPPTEQAKQYEELGCGNDVFVRFTAAVREESAYLLKATVTNLASGQATSYYLQPGADGQVDVGHNMCTGAFELERGRHFTVFFALLDAAGNTTRWKGKPITFTRPDIPGLD